MKRTILFLALLAPLAGLRSSPPAPAFQQTDDDRKFAGIKARHDRGEPVTEEERAFAMAYMARQNRARQQEWARTHPPRESTGLAPLTDLGKQSYKGEEGGLYPGGQNTPPAAHAKAAPKVVPLDAAGQPSANGRIVLLSIGMSNTTQEFQMFQKLAAADPELNPKLAIVDGAQGGQTAAITARPGARFWTVVGERLERAGVTPKQVQVVWLKQANAQPKEPFPVEARKLQADLVATLHNLAALYPNLKIAYLSSRTYGGWALTPLNPEPHAYETAFAVKWTIAAQLAGDPEVRTPWIAWGPYLWTDGVKGRSDGLTWQREDTGPDGTHPSMSGREKVAKLLLAFFKTDSTSRGWFLAKP